MGDENKKVEEVPPVVPAVSTTGTLISTKEACAKTGLSRQTIYKYVSRRQIQHVRIGIHNYYPRQQLLEVLEASKAAPRGELLPEQVAALVTV